jgi:Na+/serine symporter
MDSTDNEYINSLSTWRYQQLIICIISILISTLLVFGIFIIAAVIIICQIRRNKRPLNLSELRPINELL